MKTWRDINHNPFKLCYWHSHQRMLLVVCFFSYPAGKTCFDSESILLLPRVMFATNRALTFFPFSSYYLNTKQELSVPLCAASAYVFNVSFGILSFVGHPSRQVHKTGKEESEGRVETSIMGDWCQNNKNHFICMTLFKTHSYLLHSLNTSHGLKISVHARAYTHIHLHRHAHKCTKIYLNLSSAHVC